MNYTRLLSAVLSAESCTGMMFATPLSDGVNDYAATIEAVVHLCLHRR